MQIEVHALKWGAQTRVPARFYAHKIKDATETEAEQYPNISKGLTLFLLIQKGMIDSL